MRLRLFSFLLFSLATVRSSSQTTEGMNNSYFNQIIFHDSISKSTTIAKFDSLIKKKSLLTLNQGFLNYNANYRSNIDTPFSQKNIHQHQLNGSFQVLLNRRIPLKIQFFLRKSNSNYFRDIADIQVAYDPVMFLDGYWRNRAGKIQENISKQKLDLQDKLKDLNAYEKDSISRLFKNPISKQKFLEYQELINVPSISYNVKLPDSVNKRKADSIAKEAKIFIDNYLVQQQKLQHLKDSTEALKADYFQKLKKLEAYSKSLQSGNFLQYSPNIRGEDFYDSMGSSVSSKWNWLSNLKRFSLGRTPVNSSGLTAKNISINGINIEYNSWFYFYLAAGAVDYRFRDFISASQRRSPQNLYLVRLGIGRIEKNYFILTAFRGQKQMFSTSLTGDVQGSITTSGISAEVKWKPVNYGHLTLEVAQSISPDFRNLPFNRKTGWKDKTNKAVAAGLYYFNPVSYSRIEANFRFTGANFQAFQSFQTNAQVNSWSIKADQSFLKRQVKLTGSISTNDFANPYITQRYEANTIFKNLNLSVRLKKLPAISLGYMPMSQLTIMNDVVTEQRFQIFTSTLSHFYRIGQTKLNTSIIYNKFFNNATDSGYIYFNSRSVFINQSFFFKGFTLNMVFSHSSNSNFKTNIIEESISMPFMKRGSISGGVRLSNLNNSLARVGGFGSIDLPIAKMDMISFRIDRDFLPSEKGQLVPNLIGNISFTKSIQ